MAMECRHSREYCLLDDRSPTSGRPAQATRAATGEGTDEAIFCRACGQVVTGREQGIEVSGGHCHTFFNPVGIVFELGCFRRAPGCLVVGPPSSEFTWFADHLWQIALCRRCRTHLGWLFARGDQEFFGLILPRLQP